MKPKDMHKCDLVLEHAELYVYILQTQDMLEKLSKMNHCLFDDEIDKATDALNELRDAMSKRYMALGDAINPIFERWSNDELA
jgi:hypothetical protein